MQCNIDARGKAVRLLTGIMVTLLGVLLVVLAAAGVLDAKWVWFVAAAFIATGGFAIFEGWKGWCVVRAMGMKTPI